MLNTKLGGENRYVESAVLLDRVFRDTFSYDPARKEFIDYYTRLRFQWNEALSEWVSVSEGGRFLFASYVSSHSHRPIGAIYELMGQF